jgi:hypothetical protein
VGRCTHPSGQCKDLALCTYVAHPSPTVPQSLQTPFSKSLWDPWKTHPDSSPLSVCFYQIPQDQKSKGRFRCDGTWAPSRPYQG